jgi:hypothetical protein
MNMNVFLVVLNAGIKFERYFKMIQLHPPAIPLPDDVLTLMKRTMQLVDLIYWVPVPREGSTGEKIAAWIADRRRSQEDETAPGMSPASARRWTRYLMANMDLETRKAYGSAIMSGHGMLLSFIFMYAKSIAV